MDSYIQTKNAHGTRGEKTLYFFTPRDRVRVSTDDVADTESAGCRA